MSTLELGRVSAYDSFYNPEKLFAIPRKEKRAEIGIVGKLPFYGYDLWNHYEVSWLNEKGKPMVGFAEIIYGCDSHSIIESKSMKLYFNSFNNTKIKDITSLESLIQKDIEAKIDAPVSVSIYSLDQTKGINSSWEGISLDALDIDGFSYEVTPSFLVTENEAVEEDLHSHLLKSNCLVTGQPDWGSIRILYKGKKINHEGLLKYIVSFRNHTEFHEQCIERIFMDVLRMCQPTQLTIWGKYTRRGGVDINPCRATEKLPFLDKNRLVRQ